MIVHKLDFLRFLKWGTKLLIAIFIFTVTSCAQNTNLESDLVHEPHNSKTAPRQILESELEYKIDQLVYKLYDLSDEEIQIVESSVN